MHDEGHPQPEPSDEALISAVVKHDISAFSAVFDRYSQQVYALAAHLLGPSDAQDVVQDVFLRLWRSAATFDGKRGTFRTWFLTIARNQVVTELRRRGLQQRLAASGEVEQLLARIPSQTPDVEEQVWLRVQGGVALRALQTLPQEQQKALVMAYFGGFSHSEIAARTGWPLGTVKKRLRLGLQKLRRAMGGGHGALEASDAPPRKAPEG